ncbi:phospho-sugar mutase [Oerskovia merdavium]|uniref:Phospho-sugar mutase n=1 Tax=Oerskovia merdavium TaxID=2762227 RepID=A0ABR8TZP0_9CELL|nr:phospho-sugar mutase [Oerskovia merdavium]MBD7981250.1 phospho-sugar mutase [Oerskovia merdavium]
MTNPEPLANEVDDPGYEAGAGHAAFLEQVEAWIEADPEPADQVELRTLLTEADSPDPRDHEVRARARAELRDRFSGTLQFGTAGLRGEMAAGPNRMNRAVVIRAAAGLASFLRDALPGQTPRVVIGYDARHHSHTFAQDSAAVFTAAGVEASILPSALPTPVLAYAVRHLGADAGVMVTASHNPPQDNGYKVYLGGRVVTDSGQGAQIVPPYDAEIAAAIRRAPVAARVPRAVDGWTVLGRDLALGYVESVGRLSDGAARDLRIVATPLHGVGGAVVNRVLEDAGFTDVISVAEQFEANPLFPTVAFPNPEEPGAIDLALAYAQDAKADLVIANDPDADRCALAVYDPRVGTYQGAETARSNGWRMLHGDEVGSLLGEEIGKRAARLRIAPGTQFFASSIVSSRLLRKIAESHGLGYASTLTGFKWISRVDGLVYGYEEALGYCVDPQNVRDKDGISAALLLAQLANRLKAEGRTLVDALDDLARAHGLHVTDQLSARFTDLDQITAAMSRLRAAPPRTLAGSGVSEVVDLSDGLDGLPPTDGVRLLSADGTRVIVRPSGTEPKVKCYLEVIVPVAPDASYDDLTAARAFARTRLDHVRRDVAEALGI